MTLHDVDAINSVGVVLPNCGVDYAGFVFTPHRQQISIETAIKLKRELSPDIKTVGVFIDETYDEIKRVVDSGAIDIVQFHGAGEYRMDIPAIKAFRMRTADDIKPTDCEYVLFDSYSSGTVGSTGNAFDWRLIDEYRKRAEKPFFLAGGINITNIKEAVRLNPYGIDISGGVESNGAKSSDKIKEICLCIEKYSQK